jgi:CTP:molybdopterin cytidylyltransferase MocA
VPNPEAERPRVAVDGVVLAAGRSRRMGRSKPLLGVDDTTFVASVVRALRDGGCRGVVVVIGADAGVVGTAASEAGARVVINTAPDSEQIDSLRLCLRNLDPGAEAVAVLPVDHPLVATETIAVVIDAFAAARPPIARASFGGVPGHPTLFSAALFEELLEGDLPDGARSVIARHAAEVLDVTVDDAGVTADIDTPDDYRRHVGGEPRP